MTSKTDASARPAAGSFAKLVAAGIFLSRVSGLVREMVLAAFMGATLYADVFRAALRIPNFLQNLLGEGTLSASFVPVYSELQHQDKKAEAGRVAGAVFLMLGLVAATFGIIGVVAAPQLVDIIAHGFEGERRDLAIRAIRIIFPMTSTLVLSAWALGILNSHRRFFISYVAPVVWNLAIIATPLIFARHLGLPGLVIALCWAALIGGVLQFVVQLPFVLRDEKHLSFRWSNTKLPESREVVRNAWPAILSRGVVQISAFIDVMLASMLAVGAMAVLGYAATLYLLPISLFGMSVAASELPDLARQRLEGEEKLRARVRAGLRQMAVFVVPSVVGYLLLGDLIVSALYERGKFTADDTIVTFIVLAGYTLGLQASSSTRLLSSTFFALRDTRRPAIYATIRVVLGAALGFTMMFPFERMFSFHGRPLGALGLSLAAGVGAWVEWALLRHALSKRIGSLALGDSVMLKLYASALIAAVAARGIDYVLPDLAPALRGAIILAPFGILYFLIASALRVPEAQSVLKRVLRRA